MSDRWKPSGIPTPGRMSLIPTSTTKTPTRPRFTGAFPTSSRKTDTGARFSLGGIPNNRTSFMKPLTAFKESRPISSKDYQTQMIQTIYQFLLENDDEVLPEKNIRQPMKQDFCIMFESIYQHLSPNYVLQDKKLQEEVPRIFRELGYPPTIKPSMMQTIGASHTWPTLLAALVWLIEFVQINKSLEGLAGQHILLGGDNTNGTVKAYRYSWMNIAFKEYMSKPELRTESSALFEGKAAELRTWHEQQEDFDNHLQSIKATIEQVTHECAEMSADKGQESRLREDISKMEDDIRKAADFKRDTLVAKEQRARVLTEKTTELDQIRAEVAALQAAVDAKKAHINEQSKGERGIKGGEARVIMAEYDQNKVVLRELHSEMDSVSREHWQLTPKVAEEFSQAQSKFRKVMSDVKCIHCDILGKELELSEESPKDMRELNVLVSEEAPRQILLTKEEMESAIREIEQRTKKLIDQKQRLIDSTRLEQEKMDEMQRMKARAERIRRREREDWMKDRQTIERDIDCLENEKETIETQQHEVGVLEQELTQQKREYEDLQRIISDRKLESDNLVMTKIFGICDHLNVMRSNRDWMTRTLNNVVDSYDAE